MLKLALFLCTLAFSANAQTITSLTTYFNAQCPDNNQRLCTPANVRNIGLAFPNNIFVSSSNPITTTSYVSASTYYGDGSNLTGIAASSSPSWGDIIGIPVGVQNVSNASGSVSATNFTASGYMSATTYYGDGSNLTGISGGASPTWAAITGIPSQIQQVSNSGSISLTNLDVATLLRGTAVSVTGNISVNTINGVVPSFGGATSLNGLSDAMTNYSQGSMGLGIGASPTGLFNTMTGYYAGSLVTGSGNTGMGGGAAGAGLVLQNLTTGNDNTSIGATSGIALDGASRANTGVGSGACSAQGTSGQGAHWTNNVCLGAYTMAGSSSGPSIGTVTNTTAVGYQSMAIAGVNGSGTATSSQGNTTLGAFSGLILSGNSNTLVGTSAGSTITTGNGNIVIGALAAPFADTGSSQLSIGNTIYGNIGSGASNRNFIGINVSSPTVALEVSGTVSATAFVGNGSGLTNLPAGSPSWYALTNMPTQITAVSSSGSITMAEVSATRLYAANVSGTTGTFGNMREGIITVNATTATTALPMNVATAISGTIASTTTVSFNNANFTQANVVVWKPCWTLGGATITWPATARFNNNTSPTVVTTNATCSLFTLTPLPGSANILVTMPATGVSN